MLRAIVSVASSAVAAATGSSSSSSQDPATSGIAAEDPVTAALSYGRVVGRNLYHGVKATVSTVYTVSEPALYVASPILDVVRDDLVSALRVGVGMGAWALAEGARVFSWVTASGVKQLVT